MFRFVIPLVGAVILIPILILGLRSDPRELPSQYIGKPAPAFDLPGLQDPEQRVGTAIFGGEISLLNIWGTWCAGCRAEHGFLMQLSREQDIPIYSINYRDKRPEAIRWLAELGNPYSATGFDEDGRAGIDWGVYGAPETFLVTAQGHIVLRYPGPLNRSIWEHEFLPRIAELTK